MFNRKRILTKRDERQILGLGQAAERWTLTFDGAKLNVRVNVPERPEISIDSEAGG
jgi:hypothetical protein